MNPRREMRACRGAADNERCRVCSETAHGFHFGVMVCRACAAFFRRTVALNMHYHCRFDRNCQIDKSVRCMCRSCRHSKCLRVGMRSDAVQLNRDVIKPQDRESPQKRCSEPPSLTPPASNSLAKYNEAEVETYSRINSIFEDAARNPRTSSELTTIEQFRLGMNHVRQRRFEVHTERMVDPEPHRGTSKFAEISEDNFGKFMIMRSREIDLHAELLAFIQPFVLLSNEQRWLHFKQFSTSFAAFERAYDTYCTLGEDLRDKRTVLFNGQTFNLADAVSEKNLRELTPKYRNLNSVFTPGFHFVKDELLDMIKQLKLSEMEFATLCLHLLWLYPWSDSDNDTSRKLTTTYRRKAFLELHDYYINAIGMTNYASRVGDCMALMAILEKTVFQKREAITLTSLFCPIVSSSLVSISR